MKLVKKIKLIVLFAIMLIASLCVAACTGGKTDSVEIPDYPSKVEEQPNTYTDLYDNTVVTIDGTITDAEWAGQNKWEETISISGYEHHIEIWSRFTEQGVLMAYRITGAPAYYDAGRGSYANSGIEIYIANGSATTAVGNQWEMEFFANGDYHTSKYISFNGNRNYAGSNAYIDLAGRWLDQNGDTTYTNDPDNNGYEDEVMIPWYILGGKCDSIVFNAAIQYMASATSTSRSGYINMLEVLEGDNYWTSCQSWRRFDKDGYYDKNRGAFSITPYDVGVKTYNDGYAFTSHGWNNGSSQLYYNTPVAAGEDYILTTKLYAPHLAHEEGSEGWNENYANETNYLPQGQGGTETAYNGLSATRNGYKIELAFQKGWGADGVFFRWNGADWGWTNVKLTDAQLNKYMTEGLTTGMYVRGNVVTPLLEDATGELVMLTSMTKTISQFATEGETKLAVYYQCDAKFDQWKVYAGEDLNGSIAITDETEDENGSITATGKMFDSLTVTVTPKEGYELASLLVNGVEYAAQVENNVLNISYTGTKATVKATFRQTINQSITLNVTQKFAYETAGYSANGAEVILKDAAGNTYTGLVQNGTVTIKILDGEYTLTAKGFVSSVAITVEGGVADVTDVVLIKKLFSDVDETATAQLTGDGTSTTGATLQTTEKANVNKALDNKQWKIENFDNSGKVVLLYTLAMGSERQCYATIETNRSLNTINQGHWSETSGYYDAPMNNWNVGVLHTGATEFMAIFEGVNIGLYYKVNGVWTLLSSFTDSDGELTTIIFTQGEHSAIITWSDIKLYDGARAEEILKNTVTLEYNEELVTASVNKTVAAKGEEVVVTATVKDSANYHIASVMVNGEPITASADGTYKFTANGYMTKYDVKVVTETTATELTFNTTHKFAYEKEYYALPDGTVINFVNGDLVKPATVKDGKVTVSLSDGNYTVNGVAVTVENLATETTSLQFVRKVFANVLEGTPETTDNENGGYFKSASSGTKIKLAEVDMSNAVLVADLLSNRNNVGEADNGRTWADILIQPYGFTALDEARSNPNNSSITEGTGYRVDWFKDQAALWVQMGGDKNGNFKPRTFADFTRVILKTYNVTETQSKTEVYFMNIDGTYYYHGYMGKNVVSASELFYQFNVSGANIAKNVKLYDGERATAFFEGVKLYNGEATTATLDGITVNGDMFTDVSKLASEGKATVLGTYGSGMTFASEENIVAVTFKIKLLDNTFVGTADADGAWLVTDKTDGVEIIHQNPGALGYRFRTGNWATQNFTDTEKANLYTDGVEMGYYIDGNATYILLKNAEGNWYKAKTLTGTGVTKITGLQARTGIELTGMNLYTASQWTANKPTIV